MKRTKKSKKPPLPIDEPNFSRLEAARRKLKANARAVHRNFEKVEGAMHEAEAKIDTIHGEIRRQASDTIQRTSSRKALISTPEHGNKKGASRS